MTQEKKMLLLQDLCARLPYGFIIHRYSDNVNIEINDINTFSHFLEYSEDEDFKPYLRSMSSMTEEETEEYWTKINNNAPEMPIDEIPSIENIAKCSEIVLDWLNKHHFDYRDLIEKNLALDCTGLHIYD